MAEPGSGSVKLTWEAVTGATGYKITKSPTSGGTFENAGTTSGNAATTCTISSLTPGTRYYFKVQGVSGATEGTQSAEVTAIANVDDNGTVFIGDKLLVSNELTDPAATVQSTGSLSINENSANIDAMDSGELELEAYRINPVIPFVPEEGELPLNSIAGSDMSTNEAEVYTLNATKEFNVLSYKTKTYSKKLATLVYLGPVGSKVAVWVGVGETGITVEKAEMLGKEFNENIYGLVTDNFASESDVNGGGRVDILCFDIEDNFTEVGSSSYVGGYFSNGDLFSLAENTNSNVREIFYIDTYPSMGTDKENPDVSKVYSTLAHEFQHMVNYNQNCIVEKNTHGMDTWLNEALSLAAEQMYNGTQTNRIDFYNGSTVVGGGRSLLEWDNDLADYSLSYLFSQYLRTQIDQAKGSGEGIKTYKSIIEDPAENYVAVQNVIQSKIDNNLSFGQFMTNFRAAMLLKADSGPYGFNNEAGFDTISTPLYTGGTIDLKGGGAVVKPITSTSPFMPGSHGANITYLGIYN